jgi:hypothetical protein
MYNLLKWDNIGGWTISPKEEGRLVIPAAQKQTCGIFGRHI